MQSNTAEIIGNNALPLNPLQLDALTKAVRGLSAEQISWASGYLAGISAGALPQPQQQAEARATILYATHTGNGQTIARKLADEAGALGINHQIMSVSDYNPRQLAKESLVILVISTHGEGEPPESAAEFHRYLFGPRSPRLESLQFSILALGDSSYEFFCEAGKIFDARFQELGAQPLIDRVDADVDFDAAASAWRNAVLEKAQTVIQNQGPTLVSLEPANNAVTVSRENPHTAYINDNRSITMDAAVADVHHISIEIDPEQISYQPGDSLGVWSTNDAELVEEILASLNLSADDAVVVDEETLTLKEVLTHRSELTLLHANVVKKWAELSESEELVALTEDRQALRDYAEARQFIDLVLAHPADIDAQQLVDTLMSIQPRLYSIASSQLQSPDEIQLTVASVEYDAFGRHHTGTASSFLNSRTRGGDEVPVYVVPNETFRLPEDKDAPVIMIGAGTGIAPFRAFLQHREAEQATGDNWLVFGNRNFQHDFLYQLDWLRFRKAGLLNKVSLAFSRDGAEKIYVQDRLRQERDTLREWLDRGAIIYVCGGIDMEQSVYSTIDEILKDRDEDGLHAINNLEDLRAQGRYLKDVY